jgi:hypothetical protein
MVNYLPACMIVSKPRVFQIKLGSAEIAILNLCVDYGLDIMDLGGTYAY